MFKRTNVLLLSKRNAFSDILTFNLESEYSFAVQSFESYNEFKNFTAQTGDYFLIVADGSINLGEIKNCYELYEKSKKEIPFFVIANDTFARELDAKKAAVINRDQSIEKMNRFLKGFFIENPLIKPMPYCPISFKLLTSFEGLETDVYIQLPSGRYIKIYQQHDKIEDEDVKRYKEKGVETLYLKKRTAQWILKQMTLDIETTIRTLERGDKMTYKKMRPEDKKVEKSAPVEKQDYNDLLAEIKKERQQNLGQGAEAQEQKSTQGPASVTEENNIQESEQEVSKEIKKIEQRLDGTFAIDENFKKEIQQKTSKAVKIMAKKPALKKLLDKLALDRDPNSYVKNHINLLTRITCSIAHIMEWNHESTLEKLIFVSYMHDITLVDHPHLAKIQTLEEYKEIEPTLSEEEKRLYIKHPEDIKKLVEELDDAPVDAEKIIMQHHELPDGTGFPTRLNHIRILPLAAIFIVAHDFVCYILENENWTLDEYLASRKERFKGGNFTKIIRKMSTLQL
ncbi:HD domain protein [Bacteriovorax sp. BSW11_IV]|uniref:HD domain-containing phosphohydrolase n=1 Tax=Bacteriovorax sp. BSW11_IV TaxID=1353529 RepID=UPI00038A1649|nr:HD domain-containing phosphohydrolase [Bacteriovorax sp. BSW11_IV]EQC48472.1 HD domain protein [Bacteriovorax sp. BSW11_IV]